MLSSARSAKLNKYVAIEWQRLLSDQAFAHRMAHHSYHARIAHWIKPEVGSRVLELGVGPGRYAALLQTLGFKVIGVDPLSYDSWQSIREHGNAEFFAGIKAEALPFDDQSFHHVVCMGALLYFEDPCKALGEIRRVLKPGGHLIVRTQNRQNLYALSTGRQLEPAAHNFYTEQELVALLKSQGFVVTESFAWGFWPPFIHLGWWYFLNVYLPLPILTFLTALTPSRFRHNVIAFAQRAGRT